MIIVDKERCNTCGLCIQACPLESIKAGDGYVVIAENCANCRTCVKSCKRGALSFQTPEHGVVRCTSCGVYCEIKEGFTGACKRFTNKNGQLERNRPLMVPAFTKEKKHSPGRPFITAVGAGTEYPDYKPAPYIVKDEIDGVDVVTVVTEAPVSYSSVQVKIDSNFHLGHEGAKVKSNGKVVGMVTTEQYGAQFFTLGGVNLVKGINGIEVCRTMVSIANREQVCLEVEGGAAIELQVGQHPVINGKEDTKMRVGCGGASIALFARLLAGVVDEAIFLDHHIIGQFSGHPAGAEVTKPTGVTPTGRYSTNGRYFGQAGDGWGGTNIKDPRQAIKEIDPQVAWEGMTILVTETTARQAALFVYDGQGGLEEVPLTEEVTKVLNIIADNCEAAGVSALYYAGVGGSARAGVTTNPIKLTRAVHQGKASLYIGGAPAFVFPGGGITLLADVELMVDNPFTWIPTPALIAPIEYSIDLKTYEEIGGHLQAVRSLDDVLRQPNIKFYQSK